MSNHFSQLRFSPVSKRKVLYSFYDLTIRPMRTMPPFSYGVNNIEGLRVVTMTPDGKETSNTAAKGDIIMSGVSREKYVIRGAKFGKLYMGNIGSTVYPEQSPRMVARYDGPNVTFKAPWGEDMVAKKGDYIVREGDGAGFYRVAKAEFEKTYNPLPK
jgi:hypothetical protein